MAGTLTKKAGPLPVWGWAAVLVGGLALGLYLRHRNAAGASGAASPSAVPVVSSDGSGGSVGASQASAPSGLDPGLEALLANSQGFLGGAVSDLAGNLTNLSAASTYAGIQAQAQSFSFAQSVFGSALDFARTNYAGTGGAPKIAPYAPAPAAQTYSPPSVSAVSTYTAQPFGDPNLGRSDPAATAALAAHRAPPGGF